MATLDSQDPHALDPIRDALSGKRSKPKTPMMEAIILAKLYKDGMVLVDEEKKSVVIDMRRSVLVERYEEESYKDIRSILERTANGLKMAGYKVKCRWIEEVEMQETVDEIADAAEKEQEN